MPIQLNIYLGKDIVDAQINRLEELQQFFRNQHNNIVWQEKMAKIQAALRNGSISEPEVSKSKSKIIEPKIQKVISNKKHSIFIEGILGYDREDLQFDKTGAAF